MKTVLDPSRELPVVAEVDVLVVGGGYTGVGAAVSASRLGARTLIVEQFNCLGGVGTSGGHGEISQFNSWHSSERVVGGLPYELAQRVLQDGYGNWGGSDIFYQLEGMKLTLDRMVAEAGVDVLYYTFFCDTLVRDGRVIGAIVQNKSGRQAILARKIVDCTGDGDVAARAGVPFQQGRQGDHGIGAFFRGVTREPDRQFLDGRLNADYHGNLASPRLAQDNFRAVQPLLFRKQVEFAGELGPHNPVCSRADAEIDLALEVVPIDLVRSVKGRLHDHKDAAKLDGPRECGAREPGQGGGRRGCVPEKFPATES